MPSMTLTCRICDMPMQGTKMSQPQGSAAHNKCRANSADRPSHGASGYRSGCRCTECRAGQAEKMRAYSESFRAENGINPTTAYRRTFRAANGYWPNARGSDWIHPKLRIELYERDGWICHLCANPVDRAGDPNGNHAPSLDHLVPRSAGGSHDPSNLKTACRSCNSRKGVAHDPH